MTNNVYRTAQGKMVDMGALHLKNETVKAVGNMGVNARGDRVDENNRVIDNRAQQIQRQVKRQTNVVSAPVHSSSAAAKKAKEALDQDAVESIEEVFTAPLPAVDAVVPTAPVVEALATGGLAGALARAKK